MAWIQLHESNTPSSLPKLVHFVGPLFFQKEQLDCSSFWSSTAPLLVLPEKRKKKTDPLELLLFRQFADQSLLSHCVYVRIWNSFFAGETIWVSVWRNWIYPVLHYEQAASEIIVWRTVVLWGILVCLHIREDVAKNQVMVSINEMDFFFLNFIGSCCDDGTIQMDHRTQAKIILIKYAFRVCLFA